MCCLMFHLGTLNNLLTSLMSCFDIQWWTFDWLSSLTFKWAVNWIISDISMVGLLLSLLFKSRSEAWTMMDAKVDWIWLFGQAHMCSAESAHISYSFWLVLDLLWALTSLVPVAGQPAFHYGIFDRLLYLVLRPDFLDNLLTSSMRYWLATNPGAFNNLISCVQPWSSWWTADLFGSWHFDNLLSWSIWTT